MDGQIDRDPFTLADAMAAANQAWREDWHKVEEAVAMVLLPPVRPDYRWAALTWSGE